MSTLSHMAAHEIARDLGCLVSSERLAKPTSFPGSVVGTPSMQGPWSRFQRWMRARRVRLATARELRRLPEHVLRDIGIPRGNIEAVARGLGERVARGEGMMA